MDILKTVSQSFFPKSQPLPQKENIPTREQRSKEIPPNRQVLLAWEAPMRVFKQRPQAYYKRLMTLLIFVSLLLVLMGQFLLIALMVCTYVLFYALTSIPPEKTRYELDNYGIFYLGSQYYWEDLNYFYFVSDSGVTVLCVETKEVYPGRLMLVIEGIEMEKVKEEMGKHLPMREAPPDSVFDKALKQVGNKISLE